MGKTLVHRCKMVPSVRREGELGLVYTAALPRGSVVKDTFQVRSVKHFKHRPRDDYEHMFETVFCRCVLSVPFQAGMFY